MTTINALEKHVGGRNSGRNTAYGNPTQGGVRTTSAGGSRGQQRGEPASGFPKARRKRGVSQRDLLTVTMELAIMARAGVDLGTALQSLAKQARSPRLREVFQEVHADVSQGIAISKALSRQRHVFGETYVATVAAGEASGRLSEALDQLADLQRGAMRLRTTIRTLLGYPVLLTGVSALVLAGMVFFVLPQFADIFDDFDVTLPLVTRVLMAVANELRARLWLWGTLAAFGISATVVFLRSDAGRQFTDRTMINLRLIREVTRPILVGRTFRLLGTMLESGVPVAEALPLVRTSIRNRPIRQAFLQVEEGVLKGRSIAEGFLSAEVMPDTVGEMVATAERTGSLGSVAQLIGAYLEEDGESRLRTLVAMLEPGIIIVMGMLIAVLVLSVMLPMFDLATLAQ
ncbi:MAG: type II secretion system F family protein [Planctomycetota bacterium]